MIKQAPMGPNLFKKSPMPQDNLGLEMLLSTYIFLTPYNSRVNSTMWPMCYLVLQLQSHA